MNGANEAGAVFEAKQNIAKTAQLWSQNVQLVPIKKMSTHTLWFQPQLNELLNILRDKIAFENRHLQWKVFKEKRTVCASVLRM